jgi:hypothetical protein
MIPGDHRQWSAKNGSIAAATAGSIGVLAL